MNFYSNPHLSDRIWIGPFESESNFHYAYCKGELDPENRLIWTQSHSSQPDGTNTTSLASAITTLLESHWPSLETEGWESVEAIAIIECLIEESGRRQPQPVVQRTLLERLKFQTMLLWRYLTGR